ncbi:hypothetical protein SAMN04488047_1162 [Tranquillimonas alkanivorans]|uniref:LTXXQ motif family protein n=2 Tax=Tranquillimonas alkanivorans TaxID=441119 RepID=A0A1I5TYA5_9RHOB|nr:hypothetical protein SAMN04488047_1162 [Tranquillimonas alkanivorans]
MHMHRIAAAAAFAAGLASAATAQSDQLARAAGVPPGVYSSNELMRIREAQERNNRHQLRYYLEHRNRAPAATAGAEMLGRSAGLDAAGRRSGDIFRLLNAREENDTLTVRRISEGTRSDVMGTIASKSQLAAPSHLSPAEHSIAELFRQRMAEQEHGDPDD